MRFAIPCVLFSIYILDNISTFSEQLLSLHHTFQPKRSQHAEKKITFSVQAYSCDYSVMNVKRSTPKAGNNLWHKCQIGPTFSRLVRTDVMGRLPKHLIVDTVQWDYNTDLHDGCQIKTNPAMVFTSFEFMHGEGCQGREMMWTLALTVCQDFTSLPLSTRLKLVICCRAACCQFAWESRFNICGLFFHRNECN